jgi:hypothetical protein
MIGYGEFCSDHIPEKKVAVYEKKFDPNDPILIYGNIYCRIEPE